MATKKDNEVFPSFPPLTKDDVELRAAQVGANWCSLLIYKDARVDQRMLDNAVGAMNWQKSYSRDNANCTVSIWDESKKQWISKEDTGTESKTEAEKGLASDSFKRACFAWGIGRELYGAPDIFIKLQGDEVEATKMGGYRLKTRFYVTDMEVDDAKVNITKLVIADKNGTIRYQYGKSESRMAFMSDELRKQIASCTDINELYVISGAHPELKGNEAFRNALNSRFTELNKKAQ